MANANNQTVPTGADVLEFLARLDDAQQRTDSETLVKLMYDVSGEAPAMWGPAIIGFGSYHYKYDSGREGDMPLIAFSPRKGKFALYIMDDAAKFPELREELGKYKSSKACLYVNKLADVNMGALERLVSACYADAKKTYAA